MTGSSSRRKRLRDCSEFQRTTVNAVIKELTSDDLIVSRRGTLGVIDRAGLKRRSCECYDRLAEHYAAVIGRSGSGTTS